MLETSIYIYTLWHKTNIKFLYHHKICILLTCKQYFIFMKYVT